MNEENLVMTSDRGGRESVDDRPSTRAAMVAAGTTAVIGAVLAGLVGVIPQIKDVWQVPTVLAVAAVLLMPAVLYLRRSVRVFLYHDSTREITKYTYNPERGVLRKGAIQNVSLRVATLHSLLDGLVKHMPVDKAKAALYDAGYEVGTTWASDFQKEYAFMGAVKRLGNFPELYVQWAHYDGSAGMGRLTVAVSPERDCGTVLLANSFLSTRSASFPLNHWFSGYIAGTLDALWSNDELGKNKVAEVELATPDKGVQTITVFDVTVRDRRTKSESAASPQYLPLCGEF